MMTSKITLNEEDFDGIIPIPVKKIVVTSTTHIPALELLGVEQHIGRISWNRLYFFRKNKTAN